MLFLLETKREIASAQRMLEETMRQKFSQREVRDIKYPGGIVRGAKIATNGKYWYRSVDFKETPELARFV
jgi:hypothetical protein